MKHTLRTGTISFPKKTRHWVYYCWNSSTYQVRKSYSWYTEFYKRKIFTVQTCCKESRSIYSDWAVAWPVSCFERLVLRSEYCVGPGEAGSGWKVHESHWLGRGFQALQASALCAEEAQKALSFSQRWACCLLCKLFAFCSGMEDRPRMTPSRSWPVENCGSQLLFNFSANAMLEVVNEYSKNQIILYFGSHRLQ